MGEGLSIIIPTLNEEKYIGDLLSCLVNQNYKNFEVIVVDGHSDDKTKKVANKFNMKFPLKIINSKIRNLAYQRNYGVKYSKYPYLLFLDADTAFNNSFLFESMNQLKKQNIGLASPRMRPDLDIWYYNIFFGSINFVMGITQFISRGGVGACLFVNKNFFYEIKGFNPKLKIVEDHDFISKASKKFKFRLLSTSFIFSVN